jgi:DNA-binding transcriptional LysR family regulator
MSHPERLSDLAVFVAVINTGSFTAAAAKLELSKSMVSKCVNRLEAALGARLLHRTTRRLNLTEAGSALFDTGNAALAAIDDATLAVSNLQGAPRGRLKVASSPAFGTVVLPRIVRKLTTDHPELSIELLLDDRHVDLIEEGVDVALRITGEPPETNLVYRRLGPNRQVICASPAYLKNRGTPSTPHELAQHDCIAHTQRATPTVWQFTSASGGKISVKIAPRVAVTSSLALRTCALEGLGIVEINSYIVGADLAVGRLVRLLEGFEPRALSVYAVFPQRRFLAPKVRVFIDAMAASMTPEPYWDAFLSGGKGSGGRRERASQAARR